MSLYNMLFGFNPARDIVLAALNVTTEDIPRFRDAWVDDGRLVIYTRTGGGNRDFYEDVETCLANFPEYFSEEEGAENPSGPWNEDLRKIDGYLSDQDDDFDSTYAYFYYSIPEWAQPMFSTLEEKIEAPRPLAERMEKVLGDIESGAKTPQTEKVMELGREILSKLEEASSADQSQPV